MKMKLAFLFLLGFVLFYVLSFGQSDSPAPAAAPDPTLVTNVAEAATPAQPGASPLAPATTAPTVVTKAADADPPAQPGASPLAPAPDPAAATPTVRTNAAAVDTPAEPGANPLAPAPAAPFLDLVAITRAAYPEYPPYGDPELVPVPHCTVGTDDDSGVVGEMARELRAGLGPQLPIRCRAAELTLLEERPDQSWATRATFLFEGPA